MSKPFKSESYSPELKNPAEPPFDEEINSGAVFKVGIALIIMSVLAFVGMWPLTHFFVDQEKALDPPPSPFQSQIQELKPPGPRLQEFPPTQDIQAFRHWENERLEGWAVVDEQKGTVRIPVERAMDLLLERGLPVVGEEDDVREELFGDQVTAATAAPVEPAASQDESEE